MKIHAYILCYNEEDIIRNTLSHYSEFCSRVFLMDNMSTDRTLQYASEYDKVTVIPWADETIDQHLNIKMKAKTFRDYSRQGGQYTEEVADWIIACDADEILYHPRLTDLLATYKKQGVTVPLVTGFNMLDEKNVDPARSLTEQFREGVRTVFFDKRIVFDSNFDMHYSGGAHPRCAGFHHMKTEYNYLTNEKAELALLHYKYVGNRYLKVARKYFEKAPLSTDGSTGCPVHYSRTMSGSIKAPRGGTIIIEDNDYIDFSKFEPCVGDKGLDEDLWWANRAMHAVNLQHIALRMERQGLRKNLSDCIALMEFALRLKPHGKPIRNKLAYYRSLAREECSIFTWILEKFRLPKSH